jgi:hypothetical protein
MATAPPAIESPSDNRFNFVGTRALGESLQRLQRAGRDLRQRWISTHGAERLADLPAYGAPKAIHRGNEISRTFRYLLKRGEWFTRRGGQCRRDQVSTRERRDVAAHDGPGAGSDGDFPSDGQVHWRVGRPLRPAQLGGDRGFRHEPHDT